MPESKTTEMTPEDVIAGRWPKVNWKAGDKITIELNHKNSLALNYQHSWMVSLDTARLVAYEVC